MDDMCKILLDELDNRHLAGRPCPKRSADLLPLVGYDLSTRFTAHHVGNVEWEEVIPFMPRALRWLKGPNAFIPPKAWPTRLGTYMERSLGDRYLPTPLEWAIDFCPQPWEFFGRSCPHAKYPNKFLFEYPDVGLISLAAHGYVLSEKEEDRAIEAYRLLLSSTTFLIWFLNLDVSHLSPPSRMPRLARGLAYNPLAFHAQMGNYLLGLRPLDQLWGMEPRPTWVPRSTREPSVALKLPPDLATAHERQYQFLLKYGVLPTDLPRLNSSLKKRLRNYGAISNG